MELKINGHFSYNIGNKLKFIWVEDDSYTKLERHCNGILPYNKNEFTVVLPPHYKELPSDIAALFGLKLTLYVRIVYYKFKSHQKYNNGEYINGTKLVLINYKRYINT